MPSNWNWIQKQNLDELIRKTKEADARIVRNNPSCLSEDIEHYERYMETIRRIAEQFYNDNHTEKEG